MLMFAIISNETSMANTPYSRELTEILPEWVLLERTMICRLSPNNNTPQTSVCYSNGPSPSSRRIVHKPTSKTRNQPRPSVHFTRICRAGISHVESNTLAIRLSIDTSVSLMVLTHSNTLLPKLGRTYE
jgi:hypothetical protein